MITQNDLIGIAALIICPPIIALVYLVAWGLCRAARIGEEQGEREWREWIVRRGDDE